LTTAQPSTAHADAAFDTSFKNLRVRRVTVEGEAAVSVDGRRSRTRTRPEAVNDEQIRQVIAQSA